MHTHFIAKFHSTSIVWLFAHPCIAPALLLGRLALDGLLLACLLMMALLLLGGLDLHSVACRLEGLSRPPCTSVSCCAGEHHPVFILLAASHNILLVGLPPLTPAGGMAPGTCVPSIVAMGVAVNWFTTWDVLQLLVLLVPALVALLLRALVAVEFFCLVARSLPSLV